MQAFQRDVVEGTYVVTDSLRRFKSTFRKDVSESEGTKVGGDRGLDSDAVQRLHIQRERDSDPLFKIVSLADDRI